MRCNLGLISHFFNGFDAMQDARSRRPQLYFIKKPEKLYPFAIVSFARLFDVFFWFHALKFQTSAHYSFTASTIIVATPI